MADTTEEKLEKLAEAVEANTKMFKSSSKTLLKNAKDKKVFVHLQKVLNRTYDQYAKKVKRTGSRTHEFADALKAGKKDLKNYNQSLRATPLGLVSSALGFLKDAIFGVGAAMLKTALNLSDITQSTKGLGGLLEEFETLKIVGPFIKEFGKEIDANTDTFIELAKMGASFGSSIVTLRELTNKAGMPLEKFKNLIGSNSIMLAKMFGTVDQGIPQIANLTKGLRRITQDEFSKFGLTLDDTSGYLTTYLELERARGNTTRLSQQQLLNGTRAYTKDLVTLSKMTGKSVDELDKQNMAMAADGAFQSQLAGMDKERAKTLSLAFGELNGPLKLLGKEFLGLGSPISDTSRDLEAMSDGRFGEIFKKFKKDGDMVSFQNSIKSVSADVIKNSKSYGQASLAGGRFTEALNAMAQAAGIAVDPSVLDKEKNAVGDNIKNLVALRDETDLLKTAFEQTRFSLVQSALYDENPLLDVANFISEARETFEENLPKLKKGLDKVVGWFGGDKDLDEDAIDTIGKTGANKKWSHMETIDQSMYANATAQHGTRGFQDFGKGTPATLHGSEMVLPEDNIGQLAKMLTALGTPIANETTNNINNNSVNNSTMDISQLVKTSQESLELNKKVAQHLNMLVTIGTMTEKNTKNTNKELAEMGGSLV